MYFPCSFIPYQNNLGNYIICATSENNNMIILSCWLYNIKASLGAVCVKLENISVQLTFKHAPLFNFLTIIFGCFLVYVYPSLSCFYCNYLQLHVPCASSPIASIKSP